MIKKIIFTTFILSSVSYAYNANAIHNESSFIAKEQKTYKVWSSEITNNASGETCQDENCIEGSKCFTKDGPLQKCVTKVSKKITRLCKKF